jgi:hypothetical protein
MYSLIRKHNQFSNLILPRRTCNNELLQTRPPRQIIELLVPDNSTKDFGFRKIKQGDSESSSVVRWVRIPKNSIKV